METSRPKIGIVYLLYYHNQSHVDDVVSALKKLTYPRDQVEFIVVANPHPKEGSFVWYIEETVIPLSGTLIPNVTLLPQKENLGFAGGNNVGAQWAIENGCEYVFFHNNDGFFASNALEPLLETMEQDKSIGAAQSLMLLHPETDLINSTGNSFQYLGFGFCSDYRHKIKDLQLRPVQEISYASGAALLMRADLMRQYGMWDHDFFLYHEDLEWSFRLRALGYKIVLVRDSVFYHKYQFSRSIAKFYWMERNRYGTMLIFFKWPTLLLLLPMGLVLEVGLWLFALKGGWLKERVKVYQYWMKPGNIKLWLGKRRRMQQTRVVSDRFLLSFAKPTIEFQENSMRNPILRYIGNPIMKAYYYIVVRGLIWW